MLFIAIRENKILAKISGFTLSSYRIHSDPLLANGILSKLFETVKSDQFIGYIKIIILLGQRL